MKITLILVAAIPSILFHSLARADSLKDVRKAIDNRYRQMNRAYETKDIALIENLFAEKCYIKQRSEGPGIRTKQFIAGTKGLLASTEIKKSTTKIQSFTETKSGYQAKVLWEGESWLTRDPRTGKQVASKPRKTEQTMTDTWSKTNGDWRIVSRIIEK